MKFQSLRLSLLCLLFLGLARPSAQAQLCQVDSQYTSPGVYPSDTLPDMLANSAYNEVVQFVFPSDTVVFGFTLNFDSFVVAAVTGIPAGISWECNANPPSCHYICHPPALTRGCVKVFGTPTSQSPAYPAYDSIIVTGQAWVTVPFSGATSFNQDIPVYYRVSNTVGFDHHTYSGFDLKVVPNPVMNVGSVSFKLGAAAEVELKVLDVFGKEVARVPSHLYQAGLQDETLRLQNMAPGVYFLHASVNGGEFETTQKFLKLN